MANEVTKKTNTHLVSTSNAAYAEMFAAEAQRLGTGGGGGHMFLKFNGNDGEYSYGANNDELPLGSLLALNVASYKRGWICWNDGEVVDEIMATMEEGAPPAKTALPDHGPYVEKNDGWSEQYTIEMRMIEEPHINLLFQANNESKRRAFKAMMNDFMKSFRIHEGCVPVIEIDEVEFEGKAKEGKRKYRKHAPVFKIVDWKPEEELAALLEGSPDDYEAEEDQKDPAERRTSSRDEEEDERPARRASRRDEEPEEEERPSRASRARAAAVEEEEEEERPARRASRRDEEEEVQDEDERPRSGAAARRKASF